MRHNIDGKIDEPLVRQPKLSKFQNISSFQPDMIVKDKINTLYNEISSRYIIREEDIYNKLYLKVRKMFIEEES